MYKPSLSIVVPWCDREELRESWRQNQIVFKDHPVEYILVNCAGNQAALDEMIGGERPPWLKVIEVQNSHFNKCLAQNIGVSKAISPRLLFLDADVVFQDDSFVSWVLETLTDQDYYLVSKAFDSIKRHDRLPNLVEYSWDFKIRVVDGKEAKLTTSSLFPLESARSAPGIVALTRKNFVDVNGMNSDLCGWGFEDIDLLVRLQLKLGIAQKAFGDVIHLSHSHVMDAAGRQNSEISNLQACLYNYGAGYYDGTYREDIIAYDTDSNTI